MISDFDAFQASAIVEKTSKTGLSSNKRVLAISKGVLYYYSNVPKDFKPSTLTLNNRRYRSIDQHEGSTQVFH